MTSLYNWNSGFLWWQPVSCIITTSLITLAYSTSMNSKITLVRHPCLLYILCRRVGWSTKKPASLRPSYVSSMVSPGCSKYAWKWYDWNDLRVHKRGTDKGQVAKDSNQYLWSRDTKTQVNGFWRPSFRPSEDHNIEDEISVLEGLCNTNIRDGSAQEAYENITPSIFQEFTQAVQGRCPLIHEVIEALVISNQQEHNIHKTNSHKMLCGLQT